MESGWRLKRGVGEGWELAAEDFCCGARQHREAAIALGALPRLLGLLDADEEVAAAAAQTLRNLAAARVGAVAVASAGGVRPLVRLAGGGGGGAGPPIPI